MAYRNVVDDADNSINIDALWQQQKTKTHPRIDPLSIYEGFVLTGRHSVAPRVRHAVLRKDSLTLYTYSHNKLVKVFKLLHILEVKRTGKKTFEIIKPRAGKKKKALSTLPKVNSTTKRVSFEAPDVRSCDIWVSSIKSAMGKLFGENPQPQIPRTRSTSDPPIPSPELKRKAKVADKKSRGNSSNNNSNAKRKKKGGSIEKRSLAYDSDGDSDDDRPSSSHPQRRPTVDDAGDGDSGGEGSSSSDESATETALRMAREAAAARRAAAGAGGGGGDAPPVHSAVSAVQKQEQRVHRRKRSLSTGSDPFHRQFLASLGDHVWGPAATDSPASSTSSSSSLSSEMFPPQPAAVSLTSMEGPTGGRRVARTLDMANGIATVVASSPPPYSPDACSAMAERARQGADEDLVRNAARMGADHIIGLKYDMSFHEWGVTVRAYGMAVVTA